MDDGWRGSEWQRMWSRLIETEREWLCTVINEKFFFSKKNEQVNER